MPSNSKEYQKEYMREYRLKNNQNKYKKSNTLNNWRRSGVKGDLDELYKKYVNTDKCEICEKVFSDTYNRCLDHDHETGEFRNVLCRSCNTCDSWKNKIKD